MGHAWLSAVDQSYLNLARRVRDQTVAQAEAEYTAALQLVAKELRVPDGVAVRLVPQDAGIRMEWDSGLHAGDVKPMTGNQPHSVTDA